MKLTVERTIGNKIYKFEFEGADLHECLMESQKVGFYDLRTCQRCQSPYIKLYAYITKEEKYKYVKVVCEHCRASLTLGQAKKDNTYYFRKDDMGELAWQEYQGDKK